MTDLERMELSIRRVSERLKSKTPWDMAVTEALDALADDLAGERSADPGQGEAADTHQGVPSI